LSELTFSRAAQQVVYAQVFTGKGAGSATFGNSIAEAGANNTRSAMGR
jgi:hypothetical protein